MGNESEDLAGEGLKTLEKYFPQGYREARLFIAGKEIRASGEIEYLAVSISFLAPFYSIDHFVFHSHNGSRLSISQNPYLRKDVESLAKELGR